MPICRTAGWNVIDPVNFVQVTPPVATITLGFEDFEAEAVARGTIETTEIAVTSTANDTVCQTFDINPPIKNEFTTRCVEAVVHGSDLVPPVDPDPRAVSIASSALIRLLVVWSPELTAETAEYAEIEWINIAAGRDTAHGILRAVMPLMA